MSYAQATLDLPAVGQLVMTSDAYIPTMLRAVSIRPDQPLVFDFIVDSGNSESSQETIKAETEKLAKYFLATLTIPEKDLWVNLSPYEKDRIIPDEFGQTVMGKDLLAQDYILKQLTASLMYPENQLGREFWDRVYQKTREALGTTEIPANTFSKVWIVPDRAVVYEMNNTAIIGEAHLKVMMEEDYLALEKNANNPSLGTDQLSKSEMDESSKATSQIVREMIVPEIEKEVNEGKNFALLRQVYNALILATWYKQNLQDSLLAKVYADQKKINGVETPDQNSKEEIFQQYIAAYKVGVFNFIKEEVDPQTQEVLPRRYFSGGAEFTRTREVVNRDTIPVQSPEQVPAAVQRPVNPAVDFEKVTVVITKPTAITKPSDSAMSRGREMVDQYMARITQMKSSGAIKGMADSNVKYEVSKPEADAYLQAIQEVMAEKNVQVVNAEVLFEAAKRANKGKESSFDGKLAVQGGTMNPITYGHLTASLAATIDAGLDGVIIANGGTVPDKPYASSAEVRNEMARKAVEGEGLQDYVKASAIRQEVVDMFGANPEILKLAGADEKSRRFNMDIAAFVWLFAANPKAQWMYVVGSDKVREYGKKDERELLLNALNKNGVKVLFLERTGDEVVPERDFNGYPWMQELWNKGFFVKSTTPSYAEASATKVRKAVQAQDDVSAADLMPRAVYQFVQNDTREGRMLRKLYVWEQAEKDADTLAKSNRDDARAAYRELLNDVRLEAANPNTEVPTDVLAKLQANIQKKADAAQDTSGDTEADIPLINRAVVDKRIAEAEQLVAQKNLPQAYKVYDSLLTTVQEAKSAKTEVLPNDLEQIESQVRTKVVAVMADILNNVNLEEVVTQSKFALYSGPPAGGKGDIWKEFSKRYAGIADSFKLFHTRGIRTQSGESQGTPWNFRTEDHLIGLEAGGKILTSLVNNQLQGIPLSSFEDQWQLGQDSGLTDIEGLDSVFTGAKVRVLEGGFGWFLTLRDNKDYRNIATVFISPFSREQIQGFEKSGAKYKAMFEKAQELYRQELAAGKLMTQDDFVRATSAAGDTADENAFVANNIPVNGFRKGNEQDGWPGYEIKAATSQDLRKPDLRIDVPGDGLFYAAAYETAKRLHGRQWKAVRADDGDMKGKTPKQLGFADVQNYTDRSYEAAVQVHTRDLYGTTLINAYQPDEIKLKEQMGHLTDEFAYTVFKPLVQQVVDRATLTKVDKDKLGGIDFDPSLLNLKVERTGDKIQVTVDPAELQRIQTEGVDGFMPVIINIVPVKAMLPALGLSAAPQEEALAGVS